MKNDGRAKWNERFYRRFQQRRPDDAKPYEEKLRRAERVEGVALEAMRAGGEESREAVLETIVRRERPVLFVRGNRFDTENVADMGIEGKELIEELVGAKEQLLKWSPYIGRIDVLNFPGAGFLGTGWLIDTNIVVTNRHVASLIATFDGAKFTFSRGIAGKQIEASLCNAHEFDDGEPDPKAVFKIDDVLYIEPVSSKVDIAFVRVKRQSVGVDKPYITIADKDAADDETVCVIGYPARASRQTIPDQALMEELYRGRYDVKRAAPGLCMGTRNGSSEHDCTTLGGNSGSVVLNLKGEAVGLHYAGLYQEANYAVPAAILRKYQRDQIWTIPRTTELRPVTQPSTGSTQPVPAATGGALQAGSLSVPGGNTVNITIPLTVSIGLGTPVVGHVSAVTGANATSVPISLDAETVQQAVLAYWDARPQDVLAARVGYLDDAGQIGDTPCIAVSVAPSRLAEFATTAPRNFQGVPVRYLPADVDEQVQAIPGLESVDSISYDDNARKSARFSLAPITEQMEILAHVGPEYSWDELRRFLAEARDIAPNGDGRQLVSAMYEFHAKHIKDAIEDFLDKSDASMTLVLDNATFTEVKHPSEEFDRDEVFAEWDETGRFQRVVAPEGRSGLISDSYHIKVTVRHDDVFWLSSGNWKAGSSQPIITQAQRDNATEEDLPGNREWHVIVKSPKLATRFRSHILQDFKFSTEFHEERPEAAVPEIFVDVPLEEAVEERRPPSAIVEPKKFVGKFTVHPLLTPDKEGAVYSEAVLDLIKSAKDSLLFQIPYIGMPSNPRQDRGYIDELIRELTKKLKSLSDARVILRTGSSRYSAPSHAAWYFKSKGVDINNRLRVIENHHTKGMIVDGERVLIGSHNWSKPGVSLNRDASLIIHEPDIAAYYAEAFEIDWKRANRITPRRFVKTEAPILEATGFAPPPGYQRVPLSELLKDD